MVLRIAGGVQAQRQNSEETADSTVGVFPTAADFSETFRRALSGRKLSACSRDSTAHGDQSPTAKPTAQVAAESFARHEASWHGY
ncbi:hypothetical protein GUJ93_ZPchr0008g13413 [Zizania palustris]|uniref:Uncharacterized protein n=1 Tax=Zizania palustris TaxID=103762 RepID=A0A8J5RLR6_ZIZPA|nr:hypothetical protein GUJ93_ZPchr0008g13413 [Zizania palustris]